MSSNGEDLAMGAPSASSPIALEPSAQTGGAAAAAAAGNAGAQRTTPGSSQPASSSGGRMANNNNNNNNNSEYRRAASPFSSSHGVGARGAGRSNMTMSPLHSPFTPTEVGPTPRRNDVQPTRRISRRTPRTPTSDAARSDDVSMSSDVETTYVWGTNVNIANTKERFRRFIHGFEDPITGQPKYPTLLKEMVRKGDRSLNLDCTNLHVYDAELYRQLVAYPSEVIPLMDLSVHEIAKDLHKEDLANVDGALDDLHVAEMEETLRCLQIKTFNLHKDQKKNMRDLNPTDIDQLVCIRGMVTRTTNVIPDLKAAFFRCSLCGYTPEPTTIDRNRIQEPTLCGNPECAAKMSFQLVHNRCTFSDKQQVRMQETPDAIPEGETPHSVTLCTFDDLVDVTKPGDRIEVTGVYRAVPVRVSTAQRGYKSIYKTYIDVIHVRKDKPNRMRNDTESGMGEHEHNVSYKEGDATVVQQETMQQRIEALAQSPDIYERLTASVAPSIWELDDIKKGILCLLFGGTNKEVGTGPTQQRCRGEVNVLLVGDPGTSKSQLLGYVHKLAPRGIYTSGRGSSAVGLTAYVTRDPETKEMVLESGALVLSDRGVCCIDEFDKMSDSARAMLHEVMEQQTVSVAKAGIICTLNARTSVLASANPVGSRYNPRMSVVENIQLPPTLLSRFDLIYLMLDKADEATDRRLARHLVNLHGPHANTSIQSADVIEPNLLGAYISHARTKVHPCISEEAEEELVNAYVEMRQLGLNRKVVTATPRQLEALIRLSEALARMRLSGTVERSDVQEARRLMQVALQQSATDPRTGTIDMDLIQTGVSAAARKQQQEIASTIRSLLGGVGVGVTVRQLLEQLNAARRADDPGAADLSVQEVREAINQLQDADFLLPVVGDVVRVRTAAA